MGERVYRMNVKEQILDIFENNRGIFISGAELAAKLSVSRNAVWKAVKSLQEEGYEITAVTNRGYCLDEETDILSVQSIAKHLGDESGHFNIEVFKTLDSTNNMLKSLAASGESEGKVVISEEQTAGKGRISRSFYSPAGTGLYMSVLLRPQFGPEESSYITSAAAAAVARAIEMISGCDAKIKWVNDIYCKGKKVCGILTEASMNLETGGLEYAVLGIGVNVNPPTQGFPEEISDIASSVFERSMNTGDTRSRLAAEILNNFWQYYKTLGQKTFLREYRERSMIVGHDILVLHGSSSKKARALGIDDSCHLIVEYEDGSQENLSSGEISIRRI